MTRRLPSADDGGHRFSPCGGLRLLGQVLMQKTYEDHLQTRRDAADAGR